MNDTAQTLRQAAEAMRTDARAQRPGGRGERALTASADWLENTAGRMAGARTDADADFALNVADAYLGTEPR